MVLVVLTMLMTMLLPMIRAKAVTPSYDGGDVDANGGHDADDEDDADDGCEDEDEDDGNRCYIAPAVPAPPLPPPRPAAATYRHSYRIP